MSPGRKWLLPLLACTLLTIAFCADPQLEDEELRAIDFLRYMDAEVKTLTKNTLLATFTYDTNMTKINRKSMNAAISEGIKRTKELWKEIHNFNWRTYKDPDLKRQFWLRSVMGVQVLPEAKYKKLVKLSKEMGEILASTKIHTFDNPLNSELTLNPNITNIIATSRNPTELHHTYNEYVKSVGDKVKPLFKEYVDLMNEAAKSNGFPDTSQEWISRYEDDKFKKTIAAIYKEIKPLYTLLHSFVRHKLKAQYGDVVSKNGPIPIQLTGDLRGSSFDNLFELVKPFPNASLVNYQEELYKQKYDGEKMFKTAEDFYTSMNLSAMPELFWNNSIFERAEGTEMICSGKAYDIDVDDPRIKTCIAPSREGLNMAHREMGQVQYFLNFHGLPQVYRNGANEAFNEAVGNSIATSFMSLKHAKKLGFWKAEFPEEVYLNQAFLMLLQTLPFITFAYTAEMWRWDVFTGDITEENYNCPYWKLVEDLQGLEPPTDRSSADFDISTDSRIITNAPYISSFIGKILEYQFYKAMCLKANEYIPGFHGNELYKCDFYGNVEAGNALKAMLSLGSSKPWMHALEVLTGQKYLDSSAILEYFKPVQMWLEDEIERLNIPVGWIKSTKICH